MESNPSARRVGLEEAQTFREHLKQNKLFGCVAYGALAVWSTGVGLAGVENLDNLLNADSEQQIVYDQEAAAYVESINDNIAVSPAQPEGIVEEALQKTPPTTAPIQTSITIESPPMTPLPPTTETVPSTTTTAPPTTILQEKDCPELVSQALSLVATPEGERWRFVCLGPDVDNDGRTNPNKREVYIYHRDANDSDNHMVGVILHEIAHTWQHKLGMWPTKDTTSQEIRKLERQADDFACAFDFCFPGTSKQRAAVVCREFARRGADICPDEIS